MMVALDHELLLETGEVFHAYSRRVSNAGDNGCQQQ